MNRRLQQFISAENITQSEFADSISVARASVSHVLAGRNNPGYDFIKNISSKYPNLNLDWLINGKGKMYKSSAPEIPSEPVKLTRGKNTDSIFSDELFEDEDIFADGSEKISLKPVGKSEAVETVRNAGLTEAKEDSSTVRLQAVSVEKNTEFKPKSITRIVVFYDDGTFQELNKS